MADIKHPTAAYLDEKGNRGLIRAEELLDKAVLERAKLLKLYDASEQVRVSPKFSKTGTPFFCATAIGKRSVLFAAESNPAHNHRINELLTALKSLDRWSLALMDKPLNAKNLHAPKYENVLKMPKYQWGTEIHRILAEDSIVRHDLFGQSTELEMSVLRPWVAIEVVHTHFPDEKTFSILLGTSKRMPLTVFFDFTEYPDSFVKVDTTQKILQYRPWTYFIRDGRVWKGRNATTISTSARLQIEVKAMTKEW